MFVFVHVAARRCNTVLGIIVPRGDLRRCKVDGLTTCSGTCWCNNWMSKFTRNAAQRLSRAHFPCFVFLIFPFGIIRISICYCRMGARLHLWSVLFFSSKSDSVNPLWYPLRLFSPNPSPPPPPQERTYPLIILADTQCVQTKGIISRLRLSHQTPCAPMLDWKQSHRLSAASKLHARCLSLRLHVELAINSSNSHCHDHEWEWNVDRHVYSFAALFTDQLAKSTWRAVGW